MNYRDMHIEGKNVSQIVKALSSEVRLEILNLLSLEDMNIQTLTDRLGLGKTTVLTHLNILEEAGFIKTNYIPGTVGNQKICQKVYDRLIFNFSPGKAEADKQNYYEVNVPVGNYFDFEVYPPCGLASKNNVIKKWDDPEIFYDPERVGAGLVWCSYGFIEYKIPLSRPFEHSSPSRIEIKLELSAQGGVARHRALSLPDYIDRKHLTDGCSDVTFWVNGIEAGTVNVQEYSRGGGGKYTPTWWKGSNYGKPVTLMLEEDRIVINGRPYPQLSIRDFNIMDPMRLRIGIKKEAAHISGFNIYGAGFGNYSKDIAVKIFGLPLRTLKDPAEEQNWCSAVFIE